MTGLRREAAYGDEADDLYEALIAAHRGLSDDDSAALNARLVLLLANHVGDLEVMREALDIAGVGADPPPKGEVAGAKRLMEGDPAP